MPLPLAEHEAASVVGERGEHIVTDETDAPLVFDEQAENVVDRQFGGVGECEPGLAYDQLEADMAGRALAACDPVANRSALHGDDLLQPVAAVGGGGEAEEVSDGRSPDGGLERERGQVVALVDHDQAVGAEEGSDQPRRLMGAKPQPLALIEERIVQRRQVFELGQQRRREAGSGNREVGADRAPNLRRQTFVP